MQPNGRQPNGQWDQAGRPQSRPGAHASYRSPQAPEVMGGNGSGSVVGRTGPRVKLLGILLGASVAIAAVAIGAAQSSAAPSGQPADGAGVGIQLVAAEAAAVVNPAAKADTGAGSKDFDAGDRFADAFLDTPAGPANGLVETTGPALAVRVGPASEYRRMGTVASGTSVVITCQTHGSSVDGRYGKTDGWNYVPALGGFVSSGFVFSAAGAGIPDCSTGLDAAPQDPAGAAGADATPAQATDASGTAAASAAPAAPVTVTQVLTKTANATTTQLSTKTVVSTAQAAPVDPATVTVTETVEADPGNGADQGGYDQGGYDQGGYDENPPADPQTIYSTETERQTEYRTATERVTQTHLRTATETATELQTITKTIAGAPVTVTVPGAPKTVTVIVTVPAPASSTATSQPQASCGYPCGGTRPSLSPLPTMSSNKTATSEPRMSCGLPCETHAPPFATLTAQSTTTPMMSADPPRGPSGSISAPHTSTKAPATSTKKSTSKKSTTKSTTKKSTTNKPAPKPAATCRSFAKQRTCGAAVSWAKSHVGKVSRDYDHRCDHVTGLAYGLAYSGSYSALTHWKAVPKAYKHAGNRTVPAGGLAFFGGTQYGHVMISIGGGKFVSNDIRGAGRLSVTTIGEIEKRWGMPYLGWTQPWYQANH